MCAPSCLLSTYTIMIIVNEKILRGKNETYFEALTPRRATVAKKKATLILI